MNINDYSTIKNATSTTTSNNNNIKILTQHTNEQHYFNHFNIIIKKCYISTWI